MSFDQNDEPKTKPEEKEKKDKAWDLGSIGMAGNDMMMMVVLLGAVFLFKDEIMGIFNDVKGGLGDTGGAPTAPETEVEAAPEAGGEEADAGGGKRVSAGERRKRHRDARKGRKRESKSYFGMNIANV